MRSALLFCGVALTWTCAAFGLLVSQYAFEGHRCPSQVKLALVQVHEVDNAIAQYQIDARAVSDDTERSWPSGEFISARDLVDPWKRRIQFTCTDEDTRVASAGPDKIFGTTDDITNER